MKAWKDLFQLGPDYFERITNVGSGFKTIDFRSYDCYAAPFGGPVAFTSVKAQLDEHS